MSEIKFKVHAPRWEELPAIDLYIDQVVKLLEDYLKDFNTDKDEKIITKAMINNYVKHGILKSPVKKKYDKSHIAHLFVICLLKQLYSINDIKELIRLGLGIAPIEISYNQFCTVIEESITSTFEHKGCIDEETGKARQLLRSIAQSYANKLYVEKTFLNK